MVFVSSAAPFAARCDDPVAHSRALAGFLAGAVVGLVAATEAAAVVAAVVGAAAVEVGTAGLATPLIVGVAATALDLGVGGYVGAKLMGAAEEAGEALGSQSLGSASGMVLQGSADVRTNGRPAARALDAETCHAGKVAQGSKTVRINGMPASRVGDKTTCGGQILAGSLNVRIGGPPDTRAGVQSEVPEWVRWATLVASLLPALGQAARAIGPALAEVEATGLGRALQTGVKALSHAMEERGGGKSLSGETSPATSGSFSPRKIGSTEPGAVEATPELRAQRQAALSHGEMKADGYPDLPALDAQNFGVGVRPWNGDDDPVTIRRVIDADSNPAGSYWQKSPLTSEAEWRGGSAVQNNWNGNGSYVESSSKGLKGWIGPVAPQLSSDNVSMLPGSGEQIWIPSNTASPSAPIKTPWSQ